MIYIPTIGLHNSTVNIHDYDMTNKTVIGVAFEEKLI